jgi:hypothetical protein
LTLNDDRLTLGDGHKMRLDADPFLVNMNMINFKEKQVLVRTSQADTTKGKRVIVSDEPKLRMITLENPEPGKWKVNQGRQDFKVRVTSSMLLDKYAHQKKESVFRRIGGIKRQRSPKAGAFHSGEIRREMDETH